MINPFQNLVPPVTVHIFDDADFSDIPAHETIPPDAANKLKQSDESRAIALALEKLEREKLAYEREQQQKEINRGSFNSILDSETPYSTVDLLKHIGDDQLIKRLTKTLAAGIQLPESTVFLMGVAIFSSVATRNYYVSYEYGGSIPIGLYAVAEQPPGAAKTWLQNEFEKPFDDVDIEKRELRKELLERLKNQLDDCADDDNETRKNLIKKIKELENNPIPLLFITNTSPEALEMSLHKTNGFFSLVSSEQTLFDSLLGLIGGDKGNGKQNNNEIVLNGFDGGKSGTLRIGREAYSGRAAGGVALFAQNGSIEKVLNASNGTGLSERFLFLAEPHHLGKRSHVKAPYIDRTITAEYSELAKGIARVALNKDNEFGTLSISKNGHLEIKKYRDAIEQHLADGGAYAVHQSLRGAAGKANMQIMKIAANLHLLDGGAYEPEIKDIHITAAIHIVNSLLIAGLGLCHDKGIVGSKAEFEAIITYLSNSKRASGAGITDMKNSLSKTKPFAEMTGGKKTAVGLAIAEMTKQGLLVETGGVFSVANN
jgi:hypothetical protein